MEWMELWEKRKSERAVASDLGRGGLEAGLLMEWENSGLAGRGASTR